jgi:hypothetical protein
VVRSAALDISPAPGMSLGSVGVGATAAVMASVVVADAGSASSGVALASMPARGAGDERGPGEQAEDAQRTSH